MDSVRPYYQHGDVLVKRVTEIPPRARPTGRRVLAEGEATGHAHRLVADADVEVYEDEGTLFLRVGARGAGLTHEEHGVGVIGEGLYAVDRVREYDHFAEEIRRVVD
jgi:hypothetical protein